MTSDLSSGLAYADARLESMLRERTRELDALVDLAEAVAAAQGFHPTLQAALASIARTVGARHVAVFLADRPGEPLRFAHVYGANWRLPPTMPAPEQPIGHTLFGTPPRSVTLVEVSAAGRPCGALLIGHYKRGNPAFLRTAAANLGLAVLNAQRFEREKETVDRLSELSRLRSGFLASVSHELRTPLTAVLGFARTLQQHELSEELRAEVVGRIVEQAQRLHGLVDDLLDATRLESHQLAIDVRAVAVAPVATRVVHGFPDPGPVITADIPLSLPPVLADERRLEQVLTNLVHNAVKYSGEGARVEIAAAAAPDGRVSISVRDEGPGIDPAFLPHMFEPFTQADSGNTRRDFGVGLGLSIVRGLVEAMQGSVRVDTELGAGSTFTVTLRAATLDLVTPRRDGTAGHDGAGPSPARRG